MLTFENVVARDGIEPPTPAFSGLDSFRAIIFITKGERSLFVPKSAHLLGQEWDKILAGQNCLSHACALTKQFCDSFVPGKKGGPSPRERVQHASSRW